MMNESEAIKLVEFFRNRMSKDKQLLTEHGMREFGMPYLNINAIERLIMQFANMPPYVTTHSTSDDGEDFISLYHCPENDRVPYQIHISFADEEDALVKMNRPQFEKLGALIDKLLAYTKEI